MKTAVIASQTLVDVQRSYLDLVQQHEALKAELATYVSAVKEFVEAELNERLVSEQLKSANDRADALYRQWVEAPTDELQHRRHDNLDYCLQLGDQHSRARRRRDDARKALWTVLNKTAIGGAK